jgi:hypothetical protein
MALTSEELNYLLYRYLLESGVCARVHVRVRACIGGTNYTHTAFTFANESLVKQSFIYLFIYLLFILWYRLHAHGFYLRE